MRTWCHRQEIDTLKASLDALGLGVEYGVDALETARTEFVVVSLVAGRGPGEHYVIAVLSTGCATRIVLRIVLWITNTVLQNR